MVARCLSPRASWCYMGEDFMGKCRLLALSSARGNSMWMVNKKMMLRYLKALDMTLHDPSVWLGKVSVTV